MKRAGDGRAARWLVLAGLITLASTAGAEPIPVVLDTDIGDDIDDTWALAYLLRSPELDLRMVLTDYGDTVYRAKVAAKLLEVAGRSDVPVGIGLRQAEEGGRQSAWVEDYDLGAYAGSVREDGVQALIDLIRGSEQPIRVIAIGPAPNMRAALERAPDIAEGTLFYGMYGSVRRGYDGKPEPEPEWNVRADPDSVRAILAAPWAVTLTPLDTCGLVKLTGEVYASVRDSEDPLALAVVENYRLWLPHVDWLPEDPERPDRESTVLFDTVAVYMALSGELLEFEDLTLRIDDEGQTIEDPAGRPARCALRWKDLARFEEHLAARIAGGGEASP
jgi:inosine-uridine nucleoside N-ribohydrolase